MVLPVQQEVWHLMKQAFEEHLQDGLEDREEAISKALYDLSELDIVCAPVELGERVFRFDRCRAMWTEDVFPPNPPVTRA